MFKIKLPDREIRVDTRDAREAVRVLMALHRAGNKLISWGFVHE